MIVHTETHLESTYDSGAKDKTKSLQQRINFIIQSAMGRKKEQTKKSQVILELFKLICQDPRYWNVWRTSEHWIELIKSSISRYSRIQFCETLPQFCSIKRSTTKTL